MLQAYFQALARRLPREIERATRENLAATLREARGISRGPYTSPMLARMGHPYSRRHPRPPLPPHVINQQSGQFLMGWHAEGPYRTGRGFEGRVTNRSPHAARLLAGTARAIPRPYEAYLERPAAWLRQVQHIGAALGRSLRG